jgi:SAM-dependent methyltransferase
MTERVKRFLAARLGAQRSERLLERLRRLRRPAWMGTLRRLEPLSEMWGFDRGLPIDRFYIERFLEEHRNDISGRVLEVRDDRYTTLFGRNVTARDILDVDASNRSATIIADLTAAGTIPDQTFDCFILTQTLQFIYDNGAAIQHAHRILRPGGVLLCTVPSISRISRTSEYDDFWRYTPSSCLRLFSSVFGEGKVSVSCFGNVLAEIAFLMGMATEELSERERDYNDVRYPVILGVRALK